jgi:hypothetical protein
MTDRSLELELTSLGRDLAFPPTPDLVSAVRVGLHEPQPRRRLWWFGRPVRRGTALALAALLVAVTVVAAAVYSLGGLSIVFVSRVPSVPPLASLSGPLGSNLDLGDPITLAEATSNVRFSVFVPASPTLGAPDVVYFGSRLVGGQVSLVYGPGAGRPAPTESGVSILVTEFRGDLEERLAQKSVGPGTTVEILTVNDGLAFWIQGKAHILEYRDPTGGYAPESIRLVHNALAWEEAGTVLRIEGNLSRSDALALAATFMTVTPATTVAPSP